MTEITIKAKVTDDSRIKLQLLEREYDAFQSYLHGVKDVNLYSATKQQAERFLERVNKNGRIDTKKEYPVILRRDCIDIRKDEIPARSTSFHYYRPNDLLR